MLCCIWIFNLDYFGSENESKVRIQSAMIRTHTHIQGPHKPLPTPAFNIMQSLIDPLELSGLGSGQKIRSELGSIAVFGTEVQIRTKGQTIRLGSVASQKSRPQSIKNARTHQSVEILQSSGKAKVSQEAKL